MGQGKAGSIFGVYMSRVKRLGAKVWVVLHFKCQSADMWSPRVVGLGGLAVKLRIKSWDPVAEVWGAVVPWSGHRVWDLGTGVQCLGVGIRIHWSGHQSPVVEDISVGDAMMKMRESWGDRLPVPHLDVTPRACFMFS